MNIVSLFVVSILVVFKNLVVRGGIIRTNDKNLVTSKGILRYGFQNTRDCPIYEKAFQCIKKCLDSGYQMAHADSKCICSCKRNREIAEYKPSYFGPTKGIESAPTTSLPPWAKINNKELSAKDKFSPLNDYEIYGDVPFPNKTDIQQMKENSAKSPAEFAAGKSPAESPALEYTAEESPATEFPTAESPAAESPEEESPTEKSPAAESSTAESPATESPAAESPAVESPAAESPTVESSTAESPTTESPAAESPAAESPAAESQAAESPATESPAAEPTAAETPVAESPAAESL